MDRRELLADGLAAAAVVVVAGAASVANASSPGKAIAVLAELKFRSGAGERAASALADLATATRREHGCQRYVVARDVNDPDRFHLSELWDDIASLADHFLTPHMATFSALARELGYSAPYLKLIRIAELTDFKPAELKSLPAEAPKMKPAER